MTRKRSRRNAPANPFAFALDAWLLGAEAMNVMALRGARLALGGAAAQREAERMVAEKGEAAFALGLALATGALGLQPETIANRSVAHYRRRVRANQRRLTR